MKIIHLFCILLSLQLTSCNEDIRYNQLNGFWKCTQWEVVRKNKQRDVSRVYIVFKENKSYYARLNSIKDSGTFYFDDEFIVTKSKKAMDMHVRLAKITEDSLVVEMNNLGQIERLTLLKQKDFHAK